MGTDRIVVHVGAFSVIHGFRLLWIVNKHTAGVMQIQASLAKKLVV